MIHIPASAKYGYLLYVIEVQPRHLGVINEPPSGG